MNERYEIIGDNKKLYVTNPLVVWRTKEIVVDLVSNGMSHKIYESDKGYYIKIKGKKFYITNQKDFKKSLDKIPNYML